MIEIKYTKATAQILEASESLAEAIDLIGRINAYANTSDTNETLAGLFIWDKTLEGVDFWRAYYYNGTIQKRLIPKVVSNG